jgi:hypothetical protein
VVVVDISSSFKGTEKSLFFCLSRLWIVSLVCISVIAALSIVVNISLVCYYSKCDGNRSQTNYQKLGLPFSSTSNHMTYVDSLSHSSADESDGDIEEWSAVGERNKLVQIEEPTSDKGKGSGS